MNEHTIQGFFSELEKIAIAPSDRRALAGLLLGAATGAGTGAATGKKGKRAKRAVIGGLIGGAAGGTAGLVSSPAFVEGVRQGYREAGKASARRA